MLDGANVLPRHLNKHIDYAQRPAPPGVARRQPRHAHRHGGHRRRSDSSTSPPSARARSASSPPQRSRTTPSCPTPTTTSPSAAAARRASCSTRRADGSTSFTRFDNAHLGGDTATPGRGGARPRPHAGAGDGAERPALPLRRAADVEQRRGLVLELPRLRRLRQPRLGSRQSRRRRHPQPAARQDRRDRTSGTSTR